MPSDVLKKKKLTIGFDPKIHTHKTVKIFFNKTNCKFLPINQNLIDRAKETIKGCNKNEIMLVPKTQKNRGFFEKFFHWF